MLGAWCCIFTTIFTFRNKTICVPYLQYYIYKAAQFELPYAHSQQPKQIYMQRLWTKVQTSKSFQGMYAKIYCI